MKTTSRTTLFFVLLLISLSENSFCISDTLDSGDKQKGLSFNVIGDWGKGDSNQKKVAQAMATEARRNPIDFIISVGDNFYPHGVRSINDKRWKTTFENMYSDSSLQHDWYAAIGNHDYEGSVRAQLRYGKKNPRWKTKERYFSITKAIPQSTDSVLFVFIDTNPFDSEIIALHAGKWRQNKKKQLQWLKNTLQKTKAKWKIVVGHHPLFTTGYRKGKTEDIRGPFQPIFEQYKVDVYLSGHDHDLQHQKPKGYTNYFVSGAGCEFRGVSTDPDMTKFAKGDFGFMQFNLTADNLKVKVVNAKNETLYNVNITK